MTENGDRPRGVYERKVERPEKASMTLLSKISDCPYSGALYLDFKGGPQSHMMARGEAIHAAIEICTNMGIEAGEMPPPEVAKDVVQAVLDERVDLAMSPKEHDACRAALWNWARWTQLDPASVIGVEIMLELEIAGWKIRGKLDAAEIANGEGVVRDYKTGLYLPSKEEHEEDFQQQFYGLLLAEGVPEGETVPLGRGLSGIHEIAEFPRITDEEGRYFTRHTYKDRGQIHDFRRTVESALAKLDHGLATGEWKASPGSHCDFCPARSECPIPEVELPPSVAAEGQALEVAERILVLEGEMKGLRGVLKPFVADHTPEGRLVVGDVEFVVEPEVKESGDKDAIKAALAGAGLDPEDFYKTSTSTRFKKRKVKA